MKIRTLTIRTSLLTLALASPLTIAGRRPPTAARRCRRRTPTSRRTLGFVPRFLSAMPDEAAPGLWQEMKTLQLNPRYRSAGPGQGADRPGGGRADSLPLLHPGPHRVAKA